MKKNLFLFVFLFVAAFSQMQGQGLCDTMYWHHTYLNQRLRIYDSCVTITATIKLLDPPLFTGDGDYHIYAQPDTAYTWMISYRTIKFKALCNGLDSSAKIPGDIDVEEVCKGTPTDTGYDGRVEKAACNGFTDTVYLPNTGEHVRVVGPFIYDTVHCWNEIHPVSSMVVIPVAGINEVSATALASGLKIYPQPANSIIKFQFDKAPHAITLIKLYTITGELMYVYALSETNTLSLDISSWPTGEYLYNIVLKDQFETVKSGKFSIAH